MYLQPNEAKELIVALQCEYKHAFGGVMIYEATSSQNNQIQGQPYAVGSFSESAFFHINALVILKCHKLYG